MNRAIRASKCYLWGGGLAFCVGAWFLGFVMFVNGVPRDLPGDSYVAEAIVVLTGGSKRLEAGFELLKKDRASKLFISGVNKGVELNELFPTKADDEKALLHQVVLGYGAENTRENAKEVEKWVLETDVKSFYLVTANYHMPRSLREFEALMVEIEIVPYPVFPERVRLVHWWRWPGTSSLLVGEYIKYLASWIRYPNVSFRGGNY